MSDELVGLYLEMSGDSTLPLVLGFYKCYRAYVRGKVEGFLLDAPEVPAAQKAAARGGPAPSSAWPTATPVGALPAR